MKLQSLSVMALVAVITIAAAPAGYAQNRDDEIRNPQVLAAIKLFQDGKAAEAEAALEKLLAQTPNDTEALNALGIISSSLKKYDAALNHFDKAIALEKGNFKAIYNKFYLLVSLERLDDAEALLRQVVKDHPQQTDAIVNLGALLMQRNKLAEAAPYFEQALAQDAGDFDAHFKKGQLLLLQRKYEDARAQFQRVLELRPEFGGAHQGLAIVNEIITKRQQGYIRVRQIIVATQSEVDKVLAGLKQGEEFADLARRHSIDPGAATGGMLGFIRKGELLPAMETVIFALEVGEVSAPLKTARGYYLFYRED